MEMQTTRVFNSLAHAYFVEEKFRGFVLSGGTRSSKTFSIMQFIILYCQQNMNKGKDILIARQHYADLKDTVLKEFIQMLQRYKIYDEKDHIRSHPQAYNLFGNIIYFRGLDAMGSHGEAHDVIWINEAFEAEFDAFRQLNQRLREFFIMDYNPYFTEHWILSSVVTRDDVWQNHSTMLDNRFLPKDTINEILRYDPSNPENVKNGTADDFMWNVYGLGLGSAPKGIIFPYVNWINEFPDGLNYWYGEDFGFTTDPSALVKIARDGMNLYLHEQIYTPTETSSILNEVMIAKGIEKHIPIIADSSDKFVSSKYGAQEMVKDLKKLGWNISKASKRGTRVEWIRKLKEFRLNIVATKNFKKEQQQWRWRTVNGMKINDPIDKYDHLWSAVFYGAILRSQFKKRRTWD
jgi:phage terminase large subunit